MDQNCRKNVSLKLLQRTILHTKYVKCVQVGRYESHMCRTVFTHPSHPHLGWCVYAPESPAFRVITMVSQTKVQWKGLTLERRPGVLAHRQLAPHACWSFMLKFVYAAQCLRRTSLHTYIRKSSLHRLCMHIACKPNMWRWPSVQ